MDSLYSIFFAIPRFRFLGIIDKAIDRTLAYFLKAWFNHFTVKKFKKEAPIAEYGLNKEVREQQYIVSLTSFPGRINDIWATVETLLRQSFKPDKLILWLFEDQFPGRVLPESLQSLTKRGLTVEFVEKNLRSHTKYYYAFKQYPNAIVITVDDDIYYPKDTLKNLVAMHREHPRAVAANRVHKMEFEGKELKPYRQWSHNNKDFKEPSYLLVATGAGGVLYPPGSYHDDIFDDKLFCEICYMADDLWLKAATLRNNTAVVTNNVYTRDFVTTGETQKVTLVSDNSHGGGNDVQLKRVCEHYNLDVYAICKDK